MNFYCQKPSMLTILKMQECINLLNHVYPALPILELNGITTGSFKNALNLFQNLTGLNPTGELDELTWDKIILKMKTQHLNLFYNEKSIHPIESGNTEWPLKKIQTYLNYIDPLDPIEITGQFDFQTERKIILFQMLHNITANGKLDCLTFNQIIQCI